MGSLLAIVGLICILASAVCSIIILIAAFSEDVTQGLLSLCVPFYILYFAFARYQSDKKGLIIAIWLGGGIIGNILSAIGGGIGAGVGG